VAVTILFAFTGELVLRDITRTMSDSLDEEVQASFRSYTSIFGARAELLSKVSQIMSQMSDVRAAFSTRDQATIQDTAGELWSKISDASAIFLVTDPRGRLIASLGGVTPLSQQKNLSVVQAAAARFPEQVSGFFVQDGDLYQLSVTPVYVQSTGGQGLLLNVLVAGQRVDALMALRLKKETGGSEFIFLTPGRVIASTLNPRATDTVVANAANSQAMDLVSDGVVEYRRFPTVLKDTSGKPVGQLLILRSFEGVSRRIARLYTNILLLWIVAVSAGFALTYLPADCGTGQATGPRRGGSGAAELHDRSGSDQRRRDGAAGAHL
jgi:hypothetical protein